MSTYYEYRDVKVMIAHKLMGMDGWKVYGYKPDNSDAMTDYWDPANWGGIAEKNGYVLCVDVYGASEKTEIREYNYSGFTYNREISDKIAKLKQMTVERGASEAEEQSAKVAIIKLQRKAEESAENANKYIVTGYIPAHMAHPPKMNWHIEKDGVIIAKGNGILKFAKVDDYYRFPHYIEDMKNFKQMNREKYKANLVDGYMWRWNETEERAIKSAESHIKTMEENAKLVDKFEEFINKIDTTCGGLIGNGDGYIYENVTVTEYKKEIKPFETETGSIKDGQCFILKSAFNYGCSKGNVYRIHENSGHFYAYKLNGKLTKECTGTANRSNHFYISDKFMKWIEDGHIAWCELKEVKTPYEVQKVIKKKITTETAPKENTNDNPKYTYNVYEDVDTRTNEKIYLVKIVEKLTKEEYIKVNKYIKTLGGYYSKFKHAFLFKENPTMYFN